VPPRRAAIRCGVHGPGPWSASSYPAPNAARFMAFDRVADALARGPSPLLAELGVGRDQAAAQSRATRWAISRMAASTATRSSAASAPRGSRRISRRGRPAFRAIQSAGSNSRRERRRESAGNHAGSESRRRMAECHHSQNLVSSVEVPTFPPLDGGRTPTPRGGPTRERERAAGSLIDPRTDDGRGQSRRPNTSHPSAVSLAGGLR